MSDALSVHDILSANPSMANDPSADNSGDYIAQAPAEPSADDIQAKLEDKVGDHPDFQESDEAGDDNLLVDTAEARQSTFSQMAEEVVAAHKDDYTAYQHVQGEMQRLEGVFQQLQQIEATEDWANMDPATRTTRQADLRLARAELQKQFEEVSGHGQRLEAQQQDRVKQHLQKQNEMVQRLIPSWQEPDVRQREVGLMKSYLKDNHFTNDEIANLSDARFIALVHKGMLADQRLKASKRKQSAAAAKRAKPNIQQRVADKHLTEPQRLQKRLMSRM